MATREEIQNALKECGVTPRKSKGQNFLLSDELASALAHDAEISPDEDVLEIGPGLGILTEKIFDKGNSFVAVELEEAFASRLPAAIPGLEPSQIVNQDITKLSVSDIHAQGQLLVVGNIPYTISSQVIIWLLDNWPKISRASLLVQKEFAERIAGEPSTKNYGILSVQVGLVADVSLGRIIKGESFVPRARVDSQLLHLKFSDKQKFPVKDREFFRSLVRGCFSMRRKTLINNLSAKGFVVDKQHARDVLVLLKLNEKIRAEDLTVEQFAQLANALLEK